MIVISFGLYVYCKLCVDQLSVTEIVYQDIPVRIENQKSTSKNKVNGVSVTCEHQFPLKVSDNFLQLCRSNYLISSLCMFHLSKQL